MLSRSTRLLLSAVQLVPFRQQLPLRAASRGARCSRVVMAGESTVSLFYERPLRAFLSNGARRKEQVELPADQPFDALQDAVHETIHRPHGHPTCSMKKICFLLFRSSKKKEKPAKKRFADFSWHCDSEAAR